MALIGISSIHLLKTFIDAEQRSPHTIMWQVIIHLAFLLSALAMAWVDRMVSYPHGPGASGGHSPALDGAAQQAH